MGAARMLGALGGRLRSVAVVVGQRTTPFAPHAGRQCPLAPAAPSLPRRAPEYDDVRSVKVPPFSGGGAYSYGGDKTRASGIAGRWRRAEEEGADGKDADVAAGSGTNEGLKIAPFSTGGARSGGKKPEKTAVGGRRRTEVADGKDADVAAGGRTNEALKTAPFSTGGAHSDGKKPGKTAVGDRRRTEVADGKDADVAAGGRTNEALKIVPFSTGGAHSYGEKPGKPGACGVEGPTIDEADGKVDADAGGLTEPGFGDGEEVEDSATISEDAVPATNSCSCRYEDDMKQFIRWEMAKSSEVWTQFLLKLFDKNRRDHHEKSRKDSNRQLILTFLMALAIEIGVYLLKREKKSVEEHEKEVSGGGEEMSKGGGEEARGKEKPKSGGDKKTPKDGGEDVPKGGGEEARGKSGGKDKPKNGGGKKTPKDGGEDVPKGVKHSGGKDMVGGKGGRGKEMANGGSGAKSAKGGGVMVGMAGA